MQNPTKLRRNMIGMSKFELLSYDFCCFVPFLYHHRK